MNKSLKEIALDSGIKNESYQTVANGWVEKYTGCALVEHDGHVYAAFGTEPKGDAYFVDKQGEIVLKQINPPKSIISKIEEIDSELESLNKALKENQPKEGYNQFGTKEERKIYEQYCNLSYKVRELEKGKETILKKECNKR